jgi:hypothetical protein
MSSFRYRVRARSKLAFSKCVYSYDRKLHGYDEALKDEDATRHVNLVLERLYTRAKRTTLKALRREGSLKLEGSRRCHSIGFRGTIDGVLSNAEHTRILAARSTTTHLVDTT